MKRFILSVIAIIFPWLTLFILDDPLAALIALFLQASIIGWIPASIWAWTSIRKVEKNNQATDTPPLKKKKTKE